MTIDKSIPTYNIARLILCYKYNSLFLIGMVQRHAEEGKQLYNEVLMNVSIPYRLGTTQAMDDPRYIEALMARFNSL